LNEAGAEILQRIYSALHLSDQATYEETSPQKAHKAQKVRLLAFFAPYVLFVVKFLHSSANRCKKKKRQVHLLFHRRAPLLYDPGGFSHVESRLFAFMIIANSFPMHSLTEG
jgi:hypothetical protein